MANRKGFFLVPWGMVAIWVTIGMFWYMIYDIATEGVTHQAPTEQR